LFSKLFITMFFDYHPGVLTIVVVHGAWVWHCRCLMSSGHLCQAPCKMMDQRLQLWARNSVCLDNSNCSSGVGISLMIRYD
jgi:hypothetical protein